VVSFSYWSIKPWFHTEEKLTAVLIIPSSWGFPTGPVRHHHPTPLMRGRAESQCRWRGCSDRCSTSTIEWIWWWRSSPPPAPHGARRPPLRGVATLVIKDPNLARPRLEEPWTRLGPPYSGSRPLPPMYHHPVVFQSDPAAPHHQIEMGHPLAVICRGHHRGGMPYPCHPNRAFLG
jgi:hypothetical protein